MEFIQHQIISHVEYEKIDKLKEIVEYSIVDFNFCIDGHSPLTKAIQNGNIEIVKFLLENGADPNFEEDIKNETETHCFFTVPKFFIPLPYCLPYEIHYYSNIEIITLLLKHGANPNKNGILIDTIFNGDVEVITLLLKYGADPNLEYRNKIPFMSACIVNSPIEIIRILLKYGANPNKIDYFGFNALSYAANNKNLDIIFELIMNGVENIIKISHVENIFKYLHEKIPDYYKKFKKTQDLLTQIKTLPPIISTFRGGIEYQEALNRFYN